MSQYVIMPTMDCDPGDSFPNSRFSKFTPPGWRADRENCYGQYKAAVERIMDVLNDVGIGSKMTWFLNERDVGWSKNLRSLILELQTAGHEIGIHTHVGGTFNESCLADPGMRQSAWDIMCKAKAVIEGIIGRECISHRFGCYHQEVFFYDILKQLGYKIVSDVNPGVYLRDMEGYILDNENVPLNAAPWRHDTGNWSDYTSKNGCFLHIPVTASALGEDALLNTLQSTEINGRKLKNITPINGIAEKAATHNIKYICWHIHPHEIQKMDGGIDEAKAQDLKECLSGIDSKLKPAYMTFSEFYNGYHNTSDGTKNIN